MSKKILIIYDYFSPAFKAGGPSRSLLNLVNLLSTELNLYVICTNRDHDGSPLPVESDKWINFSPEVEIFYASEKYAGLKIEPVIKDLLPELIHINGIFSPFSTIAPLNFAKRNKAKVIISPRGMLQKHSLKIKWLKKWVYLKYLKLKFLKVLNPHWHFTTEQELREFMEVFPEFENHSLVGNIPAVHLLKEEINNKRNDVIRFLTVALISPMKNHLLALKAMGVITDANIQYHIIGPVKEESYWTKCKNEIQKLPENISVEYLGEKSPEEIDQIYKQYDFYLQPSQSENFGHAIFEALSSGVPVIISDQTPWRDLESKKAGWDVSLDDPNALRETILNAIHMSNEEYKEWSAGARRVAEKYMQQANLKERYLEMFKGE